MRNVPAGMAGTAMHCTRARARAHKLQRGRVRCSSSRREARTTTRCIDTRERDGEATRSDTVSARLLLCPPFHSISLSRFPLCGRAIVGVQYHGVLRRDFVARRYASFVPRATARMTIPYHRTLLACDEIADTTAEERACRNLTENVFPRDRKWRGTTFGARRAVTKSRQARRIAPRGAVAN